MFSDTWALPMGTSRTGTFGPKEANSALPIACPNGICSGMDFSCSSWFWTVDTVSAVIRICSA
ncbi:hypothetical protein D3C71_1875670 [compost metagenome]